jgi:hypothetical protein
MGYVIISTRPEALESGPRDRDDEGKVPQAVPRSEAREASVLPLLGPIGY